MVARFCQDPDNVGDRALKRSGPRILALFAMLLLLALTSAAQPFAGSDVNRTLSFYNVNNKERVTIQFKKNGRFVPAALEKLNWILRDWRRNEPTKMDPKLIDLIWQIHEELGSKKPVYIISGFRSLKTNNMLRRTRGGQAKRSQHILGKAMDIYFPDVPLKKLRYSGLVRQQGGVGYYPTSAIPFVHVDTGRVRHWPRMPRYELALLFPSGKSLHRPARGGPITLKDVRIAQARYKKLAVQIASFHDRRKKIASSIIVAAAKTIRKKPTPAPAAPRRRVASLGAATPALLTAPRLVRRKTARSTQPSNAERDQLARLALAAAQASQDQPRLVQTPRAASRPPRARLASLGATIPRAALASFTGAASSRPVESPSSDEGWSNGWVKAPAYDEEHPDEMSYRPFPIAPLLTLTASADDPALTQLTHPDAVRTLELLDGIDTIPPLQFRPGAQIAQLLLSQKFTGKAVDLNALYGRASNARELKPKTNGLKRRRVTTQDG